MPKSRASPAPSISATSAENLVSWALDGLFLLRFVNAVDDLLDDGRIRELHTVSPKAPYRRREFEAKAPSCTRKPNLPW